MPDLVVSGVNFGVNMGDDVTYSGTVSATFEGVLLGIPSVAFSQEVGEHFSFHKAATFAKRFVEVLLSETLQPDLLLNVNIPAAEIEGVSFTRLGKAPVPASGGGENRSEGEELLLDRGNPRMARGRGHRSLGGDFRPRVDHTTSIST